MQIKKNIFFLFIEILIVLYFWFYNINHFNTEFTITTTAMLILAIVIGLQCASAMERYSYRRFFLLCCMICLIFIFSQPVYSIIDESGHMSNIEYIIKMHKLPTVSDIADTTLFHSVNGKEKFVLEGLMYEAVHPPLYYIIVSLFTFFISEFKRRFWLSRIIGGVCFLLTIIVVIKWCKYISKKKQLSLKAERNLCFIMSLVTLCPGILSRFTTISNEGLAVLILQLTYLYITKIIYEQPSNKKILIVNVLLILGVYTKTTVSFIIVLWIIILIYYKLWKQAVGTIVLIIMSLIPWFVWNYSVYGALTGIESHLAYILPIVNPLNQPIDVVKDSFRLFYYFFYPQEGLDNSITNVIICFFNMVCIVIIISFLISKICSIFMVLKKWILNSNQYSIADKNIVLDLVYLVGIIGNVGIIVLGSMKTNVSIIIGRYLYLSLIPIIYIIFSSINKLLDEHKELYFILSALEVILLLYCLYGNQLNTLSKYIATNMKYETVKIENYQMNNITKEENYYKSNEEAAQICLTSNSEQVCKGIELDMEAKNDMELILMYKESNEYKRVTGKYYSSNTEVRWKLPNNTILQDITIIPPSNTILNIGDLRIYY